MAEPSTTAHTLDELAVRDRRQVIIRSTLIALGLVAAVIVIYFVIPWETRGAASVVLRVLVVVAILAAAIVVAIRHVLRAEYPVVRAAQALVVVVTLAIVTFASVYSLMSSLNGDAFSEPLDQVGALYFALTTATTVGFGDIHPASNSARIVGTYASIWPRNGSARPRANVASSSSARWIARVCSVRSM